MFVLGCDDGSQGPSETTGQTAEEQNMIKAYGADQQANPAGQTPAP